MSTTAAQHKLKDAKKALYRDAILDGAEAVFAEVGYEAAKVQAIASSSGVSLATLYSVFPKKWAIFRALQQQRLAELMEYIGIVIAPATDVFDIVCLGIEAYLTFHMQHPNYLRMHLREGSAWATTDVLRSSEQTEAWKAGLQMMVSGFEQGIAAGVFIDDDPELMSRTAIGMHQVRLALWIDRGMAETPEQISRYAVEQLIRTFCRFEKQPELRARIGVLKQWRIDNASV